MASHTASHPAIAVDRAFRALPARTLRRLHVTGEIARYLGAASLLVVGGIHAQQYYYAFFRVVPTIGTLFLLSFIGAAICGATLFAPVRHISRKLGSVVLILAALGGISIAMGTFVSLLISEYTPLFGFMESGYRLAVVLTLVFDLLTTALLGLFVLIAASELLRSSDAVPQ